MKRDTEKAFKWIIAILQKNNIQFQLSGGFAARLYGADRPLLDIDIEIADGDFELIYPDIKDYIIYGPERYIDDNFDLLLMTLLYENQEIDISGDTTYKLFNKNTNQWDKRISTLDDFLEMEIYGLKVPVIKWRDLVNYKEKIGRDTDIYDAKLISQRFIDHEAD